MPNGPREVFRGFGRGEAAEIRRHVLGVMVENWDDEREYTTKQLVELGWAIVDGGPGSRGAEFNDTWRRVTMALPWLERRGLVVGRSDFHHSLSKFWKPTRLGVELIRDDLTPGTPSDLGFELTVARHVGNSSIDDTTRQELLHLVEILEEKEEAEGLTETEFIIKDSLDGILEATSPARRHMDQDPRF